MGGGPPRAPTMDPPPAIEGARFPQPATAAPHQAATNPALTSSTTAAPRLGCATTSSPPQRCSRARSTIAISRGRRWRGWSGCCSSSAPASSAAAAARPRRRRILHRRADASHPDQSAFPARLRTSQPTRQHDPGQLVCLRAARSVAPMAATSGSSLPVRSIRPADRSAVGPGWRRSVASARPQPATATTTVADCDVLSQPVCRCLVYGRVR